MGKARLLRDGFLTRWSCGHNFMGSGQMIWQETGRREVQEDSSRPKASSPVRGRDRVCWGGGRGKRTPAELED